MMTQLNHRSKHDLKIQSLFFKLGVWAFLSFQGCGSEGAQQGEQSVECNEEMQCADGLVCRDGRCVPRLAEICDDGMDNDEDELVDCEDEDCRSHESCRETICNDELDNDGDGSADCDDDDCKSSEVCPETLCNDELDNDDDGSADCDDEDCAESIECRDQIESVCDDGIDNDEDELVDCEDEDCRMSEVCVERQCDDGFDNDNDDLIDCDDSDCSQDSACFEHICNDGEDNDDDDLIDCDDPDCGNGQSCVEFICDDGIDNDEDELTDCADDDCGNFLDCVGIIQTVSIANPGEKIVLSGKLNENDATWKRPNEDCSSREERGQYFESVRVTNETGKDQNIDIKAFWEGDGFIHIYRDPFSSEDQTRCRIGNDDFAGNAFQSRIENFQIRAGETIVIVASAFEVETAIGEYQLEITTKARIEICNDGLDNDDNGDTDCVDEQCAFSNQCIEYCRDQKDNDQDGATDCDDTSCNASKDCLDENEFVPIPEPGEKFRFRRALSAENPAWVRFNESCIQVEGGNSFLYDAVGIENRTDAVQTVILEAEWPADGYLFVFRNPFEPPNQNSCVVANDDAHSFDSLHSQVSFEMQSGERFIVVASTFNSNITFERYEIKILTQGSNEVCDDGEDNDQNGLIDCEDAACSGHPTCSLQETKCSDGLDNDRDGFVDCADGDCSSTTQCIEKRLNASKSFTVRSVREVFEGWGSLDNKDPSLRLPTETCEPGNAESNFEVFKVTNNSGENQFLDVDAAWVNGDGMLYVFRTPFDLSQPEACSVANDDFRSAGSSALRDVPIANDEEIWIVVSNKNKVSISNFQLWIRVKNTENCLNDIDDDGDGLVDCDDEESCSNTNICRNLNVLVSISSVDETTMVEENTKYDNSSLWGRPNEDCEFEDENRYNDAYFYLENQTGRAGKFTITSLWGSNNGTLHVAKNFRECDFANEQFSDPSNSQITDVELNSGEGVVVHSSITELSNEYPGYSFIVRPQIQEICDDRIDNNGNGKVDCNDSDCDSWFSCSSISHDGLIEIPERGHSKLLKLSLDRNDSSWSRLTVDCNDVEEGIYFYQELSIYNASASEQRINIDVEAQENPFLYLFDNGFKVTNLRGCLEANDNGEHSLHSRIEQISIAAQQVLKVIVSTQLPLVELGEFEFRVKTLADPEICDDEIDNDNDGLSDCADDDCKEEENCQEVCEDGIDNDENGFTDCEDIICRDFLSCFENNCEDDIDNDGDSFVDCRDSDCIDNETCIERICDDGIDSDDDGTIDCDDPDCFRVNVCRENCFNNIDDDHDGTADCGDSDCDGREPCSEICDDGIDNNGNGRIDCAEPTCQYHRDCWELGEEACTDTIDNNGNGLIDCDEWRCQIDGWCSEYDCDDGIDNDENGLTDCEEENCLLYHRACVEDCGDGEDNDIDGTTDCEDEEDCSTDEACYEFDCIGDRDTDSDGLIGCTDPDCATSPDCLEANQVFDIREPGQALLLWGQLTNLDSRWREPGVMRVDDQRVCEYREIERNPIFEYFPIRNNSAEDRTIRINFRYEYDPDEFGFFDFFDFAIFAFRYPFDSERSVERDILEQQCLSVGYGTGEVGQREEIPELGIEAGQTLVVVVTDQNSHFDRVNDNRYWLEVVTLPVPVEHCDDGIDNNYNGRIDCYDAVCRVSPFCSELECFDGIDNDNDDSTDCQDWDCRDRHPECNEICNDGIDNDEDGLIDCEDDDDCWREGYCTEYNCTDGIDNDHDGSIDCFDTSCMEENACLEVCADGMDNDLDGVQDCEDEKCSLDPQCFQSEDIEIAEPGDRLVLTSEQSHYSGLWNPKSRSCGGNYSSSLKHYRYYTVLNPFANVQQLGVRRRFGEGRLFVFQWPFNPLDPGKCILNREISSSWFDFEILPGERLVFLISSDREIDEDEDINIETVSDIENCHDGIDNDRDRRIDCEDTFCIHSNTVDCFNEESFAIKQPGQSIAFEGSLNESDGLWNRPNRSCLIENRWEMPYEFLRVRNPADKIQRIQFETTWSDEVGAVYLYRGQFNAEYPSINCDVIELEVNEVPGQEVGNEVLFANQTVLRNILIEPGETLTLVVTSQEAGRFIGDYLLDVWTLEPEVCGDGEDNDRDGASDCEDIDCMGDGACQEWQCGDGEDNDGDGAIDCLDLDCIGREQCIEVCHGGEDEDQDTLIDCDDPDCEGARSCIESNCVDGIDNDGDRAVDCADGDCNGHADCILDRPEVRRDESLLLQGHLDDSDNTWQRPNEDCSSEDEDLHFYETIEIENSLNFDATFTIRAYWENEDGFIHVFRDPYLVEQYQGCELGNDDWNQNPRESQLSVSLDSGEHILLVVSTYLPRVSLGSYEIEVYLERAEDCDDGIDNDRNGLIDCLDPSCEDLSICKESACDQLVDEDGDGLIGCEDPDCQNFVDCMENQPIEIAEPGSGIDFRGRIENTDSIWNGMSENCRSFDRELHYYYEAIPIRNSAEVDQQIDVHISAEIEQAPWFGNVFVYRNSPVPNEVDNCVRGSRFDVGLLGGSIYDLEIRAKETLFLIASTQNSESVAGYYNVGVRTRNQEICDDGQDNDVDGHTDCNDYDCRMHRACLSAEPRVIASQGETIEFEGAIGVSDPTWLRPTENCQADDANDHFFEAFQIQNNTDTIQTLQIDALWNGNGFLHVYEAPANSNSLQGCIGGNDNYAGIGASRIENLQIDPGQTLVIVASTFAERDPIGLYQLRVQTLAP